MSSVDPEHDFVTGKRIYMNNASASPNPAACIQAMSDFMSEYSSAGPDSKESEGLVEETLRSARRLVSEMLGCRPEELVFTQSTTDGVNAVAGGMSFGPDSKIVIRGGEHEHHANYYPWLRLAKRAKLHSLSIDENGFFDVSELEGAIDKDTRLISLSHALYNTGAILPVGKVGRLARENGVPFFVDAAQTVGCIEDTNVSDMRCDFMAFNGSKWLCGPMGIGLFYCRRESADLLEPVSVGGESVMIYDHDKIATKDPPDRFQTGFRNYAGVAGLVASAEYIRRYGVGNIRKKAISLAEQLRAELAGIRGLTLYGPDRPEQRTSIVSFDIDGGDPYDMVARLERQGIVLAVREIFDKKIIRASPHFFNSEEQIQTVADALKRL